MSDPTNGAKSVIKSYAFFDLETTGLPKFNGGKTKITELSIVACSREHFLQSIVPPRVLHKLTLCVYPWRTISSGATDVTGLSNELLEQENKFNENTGRTLSGFIQHLQSPCCLIAHNGKGFDFPILKKELQDVGVELPSEVMVADSLPIFREIDMEEEMKLADASVRPIEDDEVSESQEPIEVKTRLSSLAESYNKSEGAEVIVEKVQTEALTDELKDTEPNPICNADSLELDLYISNEVEALTNPEIETKNDVHKEIAATSELSETFPPVKKDHTPEWFRKSNETTPKLDRFPVKRYQQPLPPSKGMEVPQKQQVSDDSNVTPHKNGDRDETNCQNGTNSQGIKRKAEARRSLFSKNFKLGTVYEHYYGEPPEKSHYAEGDVITLMKCALATRESFARLVERQAIPFTDVQPTDLKL